MEKFYWLLEVVLCNALLCLHNTKDNFYLNGASLYDDFLCCMYSSFSQTGQHKLFSRSWTLTGDTWLTPNSMTQIIFKVRFCLLFYWSLFGPISGVGFVCPPTSAIVGSPSRISMSLLLGWFDPLLKSMYITHLS